MAMIEHEVRVALDGDRYRKVAREAERRGVPLAAVIRDAIDRLPDDPDARRTAVGALLAAEPMPVPDDPAELRRELDAARTPSDA